MKGAKYRVIEIKGKKTPIYTRIFRIGTRNAGTRHTSAGASVSSAKTASRYTTRPICRARATREAHPAMKQRRHLAGNPAPHPQPIPPETHPAGILSPQRGATFSNTVQAEGAVPCTQTQENCIPKGCDKQTK